MPVSINFDQIAPLLTHNSLILTPNSRTQKALVAGYMATLNEGDVVRAPDIMSFSQWQQLLWQEMSFLESLPRILGNLELKAWLNEQIVADEHWQLTNPLGVAEKILDTYRNLCLWDKTLDDLSCADTPENQYFVHWISQLEDFCKQNNLIAGFSCLQLLSSKLDYLQHKLPACILLVGFNQLAPTEQKFFDLIKASGTSLKRHFPAREKKLNGKIEHIHRVEEKDFEAELSFAAAKALSNSQKYPDQSIGVVIHQLSSHLTRVHQIFSDYFQPQESIPWQSLEKTRYNVSAGQPLIDIGMVSLALNILSLRASGLELKTLSLIKNTPFIDWGENADVIKRFLHQQSLLAFPQYSCRYLLKAIEREPEPELLSLLESRILEIDQRANYQRTTSAWIDHWKHILNLWGWMETYPSGEIESKIQLEFLNALKDCSNLGLVYQKLSLKQARDYLMQVMRQKSFQLPSDRTNVHILGVLEAAGLEFDELIMVGFNRENWPQKAKISPFLPVAFQQEHEMPGSSAEREFEYASDLTGSLINSADRIWITQSDLEEASVSSESAFFSRYPLLSQVSLKESDMLYPQMIARTQIEPDYRWWCDESIHLAEGKVSGGAYLLSQYATCPFRAMSSFQFKLKAAQQPHKGIEPKTKGAWLHNAMELLWLKLKTQDQLLSLSGEQLNQIVEEVVNTARQAFELQLSAVTASEIIQIEADKLQLQIFQWLEIEKQREPFSVVTEIEKTLSLSGLDFKFRVDRIDTNSIGDIEIIDYKTGNTDFKKWLGKRPEEAQMPAYVLACEDESIDSLSYAQIKTGKITRSGVWFNREKPEDYRFIEQTAEGIKDKTKLIKTKSGLIDNETDLFQQWRINLEHIADKILSGDMPVSPKNESESCRYCEYSEFCRISENQPENQNNTPALAKLASTEGLKLK